MTSSSLWFAVRILLILAGFASGLAQEESDLMDHFTWRIVPFELFISTVVMFIVLTVNKWIWGGAWHWVLPSWHQSPFRLLQPWQFFHASVFWVAASGAGRLLAGLFQSPAQWIAGAFYLAAALGIYLGLTAFIARNRERFESFAKVAEDNPFAGVL